MRQSKATGGSIERLADGPVREIRKARSGRDTAGRSWIELRASNDYVVSGIDQVPLLLLLPLLVLLLGLGATLLAWQREGR